MSGVQRLMLFRRIGVAHLQTYLLIKGQLMRIIPSMGIAKPFPNLPFKIDRDDAILPGEFSFLFDERTR